MESEGNKNYLVREVVAVFHAADDLENAVRDLEAAHFGRPDISIMADHDTVVEKLGHRFSSVAKLEDNPKTPQAVFIHQEDLAEAKAAAIGLPLYLGAAGSALAVVASGGALALAVAAATAGGLVGGGVGGIIAKAIGDHHAAAVENNLAAGGILLWVRVSDPEKEAVALKILKDKGGQGIHAHEIERTWGNDDVPLHDWQPDPLLR
ncbi:MAG: hypothetical protein ACR2PG_08895 [Hyphomicrobiaceae bacterium]